MNPPIRAKILIVDDLEATRFLARTVLRRNDNYDFLEATNGQEAVDIAFKEMPHLILMDAIMPVMDGFEAIRILRNDPRTSQIPILMVSALDTHDDKIRALTTGISDFIAKPFDKVELIIRVNSLLNLYLNFLQKESELNTLNNALEQKVEERTHELHQKESYTRAILDAAPNLIAVFDGKGVMSDSNQAWDDFFSYVQCDRPFSNDFAFLHSCIPEVDDTHFLNAYPTGEWFSIIRASDAKIYKILIVKEEKNHLFNITIRHIRHTEGSGSEVPEDERSYILTLNDITELERARHEREAQIKLASIGKLAAGITHEINTPLTFIKGNVELMRMELSGIADAEVRDDMMENMGSIEEGLRRIGNIIDATREITKKGSGQKEKTNIYATLVFAARMVYNRTKHLAPIYFNDTLFDLDLKAEEVSIDVFAIKEKLEQVWIVILNNAADEFLKSPKAFEERWIKITIEVRDGWAQITFKDNAGGIPEKILSTIFEPFVSSKIHSGMGIGLNIAQSIVQEHDGDISAHNEEDGAVFTVMLPLA